MKYTKCHYRSNLKGRPLFNRESTEAPSSSQVTLKQSQTEVVEGLIAAAKTILLVPVRLVEVIFVVFFALLNVVLSRSASSSIERPIFLGLDGRKLVELLQRLGPTFIKIGQVLSSRPDLVSEDAALLLGSLREQVNVPRSKNAKFIVEQSLSQKYSTVFKSIRPQPIATGSVANVYVAELLDGTPVAIKTIRKGVRWRINCDMLILSAVSAILQVIPGMRVFPIRATVDEIRGLLEPQLDLRVEAQNFIQFSKNFSDNENVRIPKVFDDYTTKTLLVMEYLDNIDSVEVQKQNSTNSQDLAKKSVEVLFQMVFVDGLVHGDLHPGNIKFQDGKTIVLLDCGISIYLDSYRRASFANFFFSIASNAGVECARIAHDTSSWQSSKFRYDHFELEMCELVEEFSGKNAEQFEVTSFSRALFLLFRRNGIRGTSDFVTTILALVVFEGIIKGLSPNLDFQAEAKRFLSHIDPSDLNTATATRQ